MPIRRMKKLDLGPTMGILANLGVIGGILLLAYELRQNNDLMAAQARYNRLAINAENYTARIDNADLSELLSKASVKEPLSAGEQERLEAFAMRALLVRQWSFIELPENELPIERWRRNTRKYDVHRRVFERERNSLDPDFVQFMEDNGVYR
jgi:hypothetical protein